MKKINLKRDNDDDLTKMKDIELSIFSGLEAIKHICFILKKHQDTVRVLFVPNVAVLKVALTRLLSLKNEQIVSCVNEIVRGDQRSL